MKPVLTRPVGIMWVPVLLSAVYRGWVFWQRHAANRTTGNPPDWNTNPLAIYAFAFCSGLSSL